MARILVIDDDPASQDLIVALLTHSGHVATSSDDSESGLERIREDAPDVVICDIQLPKMSGLEFVRELRTDPRFRSLAVVAVSAQVMGRDQAAGIAVGFQAYIDKPINPRTFVGQIEALLQAPAGQKPAAPEQAG